MAENNPSLYGIGDASFHAAGGREEENHGERPDQLPAVEHAALDARV